MSDVEVIAKDALALAIGYSKVEGGGDFQELLGIVLGVRAGGVVEEEVQSVHSFEDQLYVGGGYFDDFVLESEGEQGSQDGDEYHMYIYYG